MNRRLHKSKGVSCHGATGPVKETPLYIASFFRTSAKSVSTDLTRNDNSKN